MSENQKRGKKERERRVDEGKKTDKKRSFLPE